MTDVASITLRVDTGDLQRGNNELDKFQKAAAGAAGAADGFSKSGKNSSRASKEMAQSVDETHRRVAELTTRLRETQAAASSTGKAQDHLTESYFRQIDSIRKLETGTQELQAIQNQIRAARAAGNITQNDYLALTTAAAEKTRELNRAEETSAAAKSIFIQKLKDQLVTQSLSREELLRYRAAQLGVSSSADIYIKKLTTAGDATHSLGLKSAAARREIGVLIGEVARGNFGALRGSGITLANRAGWIDQLLTLRGLGVAGIVGGIAGAVIGLGKAWYEGSQEAIEFNKQLILTGSYAGKTADQLSAMAKSLSGGGITQQAVSSVLAKVVGSGSFNSSQIETVTRAAAAMEHATGQSVDATIKNFQKLYESPTKGSEELNQQLHYLTAAQFQYISDLERRGDREAAGQAAADAYSKAEQQRASATIENMGLIERVLKGASNAWLSYWDAAASIGRETTTADQLEAIRSRIKSLTDISRPGVFGMGNVGDDGAAASELGTLREREKALNFVAKSQEGYNQAKAEFNKTNNDGISAQIAFNKYLGAETTQAEKRAQAQKEFNKAIADNARAAKAGAAKLWGPEEIAKARGGIEKLYKDPKTAKGKSYAPSAGDRTEDSAQAETLELQTQLQVLRQHSGINDKISQQRQALRKAQAQFTVLEEAAGRRQLSAQEKSLLSARDSILAQKERLASLGDEVLQQERLNQLQDASAKYVIQMSEKRQALHDSSGLSDCESQRRMAEAQLAQGWRNQGGSLEDRGYKKQLEAARDYYAEEDRLRADWSGGVKKGWSEYLDSATNVYSSMQTVAQSTLGGMSDMLTSLVTMGTASFREFSTSILKMVVEIINKLLVAYAVQSAMGWTGSGLSAGAGAAGQSFAVPMPPELAWDGGFIPEYDGGGYTGDGGKREPKGIVHGGEFVFTKAATSAIGVDNLYAMMRGAQGYADGGYAGTAPMYGLQTTGNAGININMGDVVVQGASQQQQNPNQANSAAVSRQLQSAMVQAVTVEAGRQGTPLWKLINHK